MIKLTFAYAVALAIFGASDFIWLSLVGGPKFQAAMGDAVEFRLLPAIAFYLLYPIGLVMFAVAPALRQTSLQPAVVNAAAFGFFAYATYDLTNHATLRDYTLELAILDLTYGTIASAIAAGGAYLLSRKVAKA
ncbi:MAG: DUF2177 family protein [Micropepsaceae bacterium]